MRPVLLRHLVAASLGVLGLIAVVVLPNADVNVGSSSILGTASIVVLIALDLLVGAELVRRHVATGAERSLGLGLAYALAGGFAAAQAVRHGNDAGWAWVGWHVAFPSCFALSMALSTAPGPRRPWRALAYTGGSLVAAGVFVAITGLLPDVLRPGSPVDIKLVAGAEVLAVNLAAMIAVALRARRGTPLERWLIVAAAAASTDVVLTLAADGAVGSLGWYAGRLLGIAGAGIALAALVHEARRPQARALVLLVLDPEVAGDAAGAAGAAAERLRAALRAGDRLERQDDGDFALVLPGLGPAEATQAVTRLGAALSGDCYALRVSGAWTALEHGEQVGPPALARARAELRTLSRPTAVPKGAPALGTA